MTGPGRRRVRWGVLAVLVGAGLVVATVVGDWGRILYAVGVAGVVCGVVWLLVTSGGSTLRRASLSAVMAVVVVAAAVVAVTGLPSNHQSWEDPDVEGLGGWSARTGDLIVAGGTARDVRTGEVVWEHDGPEARPSLVADEVVVIGTDDGSVGIDPATGRELWASPVVGRGIAYDGGRLVLAVTTSGGSTEAVALDLATGATVWRRAGRPVMECRLGPADRFAPARRQSHVLLVDEERDGRAQLLAVASGEPTIDAVDCLLSARVVGQVLLEGADDALTGRSVTDGRRLWSVPSDDPWNILGGGPTVFTPAGSSVTAVETSTGRATPVELPPGTREVSLGRLQHYLAPEVWLLADVDGGAALWNPGTGEVVGVQDADRVDVEEVDVSSGWVALGGTTRDITGAGHAGCWALSAGGDLSGPFDGSSCAVDQGLLETDQAVYPVP